METAAKTGENTAPVKHGKQSASPDPQRIVRLIYRRLGKAFGRQHWWPAVTAFEVIVGAILTQNTSWKNVEHALRKLRESGALSLTAIRDLPAEELQQLIRSSGHYRQKAQRLKAFVSFVDAEYGGSLEQMFAAPTEQLRSRLLALHGIGPETADAILLYAGLHPVFVVDAYAKRIFERHEALTAKAPYDQVRTLTESALAAEKVHAQMGTTAGVTAHTPSPMSQVARHRKAEVYGEMHGLLVQAGKLFCHKKKPKCGACPLGPLLSDQQRARLQTS